MKMCLGGYDVAGLLTCAVVLLIAYFWTEEFRIQGSAAQPQTLKSEGLETNCVYFPHLC